LEGLSRFQLFPVFGHCLACYGRNHFILFNELPSGNCRIPAHGLSSRFKRPVKHLNCFAVYFGVVTIISLCFHLLSKPISPSKEMARITLRHLSRLVLYAHHLDRSNVTG
jgi:hypothetical protein